jgi:hypothetical protein
VRALIRPLSFVAISVPLFLAWHAGVRDVYATAMAHVFAVSARVCGEPVQVAGVHRGDIRFERGDIGWVDSFGLTALGSIAFAGLAGATAGVTRRQRWRMLGMGLAALAVVHWAGLWTDLVHLHWHARAPALANGLRGFVTGFGTFFFPLAIWLWMVRARLPLGRGVKTAPAADS